VSHCKAEIDRNGNYIMGNEKAFFFYSLIYLYICISVEGSSIYLCFTKYPTNGEKNLFPNSNSGWVENKSFYDIL
jgi:hypothetical protein